MAEVKLTLLDNAQNFLIHSLIEAVNAEEKPDDWKYAILHLVQAIELYLKELLRREHPSLIYRNIDKPKDTVSLEYATNRLQSISNINFHMDDLDALKIASEYRNQIVHYEFSFNQESVKSTYAKLVGFIKSFLLEHFNQELDELIEKKIWDKIIDIIEYSNELYKRAEKRFKEDNIDETFIMECRRCNQWAFVFQDEINTCYVCGEIDEVAECKGCGEYFYIDELEPLYRESDEYYCRECLRSFDDEAMYWRDL